MKRLTMHWTGGGPRPNATDLRSYHFLVDQDCVRHDGDLAPEANLDISDGNYARHAGGFNTGNIGLGLCGMLGAREHPFSAGAHPINKDQFEEGCRWAAELLIVYRLKVSPSTCLLHSEVRPRFNRGIYKWDVNWLPGMKQPGDPLEMGNAFRQRVASHYETLQGPPRKRRWWLR